MALIFSNQLKDHPSHHIEATRAKGNLTYWPIWGTLDFSKDGPLIYAPSMQFVTNILNRKRWSIIKQLDPIKRRRKGTVAKAKWFDVIFEWSLMLKVRAAHTKPTLATIFLVGSPVAFHSQEFSTLATHERFKSMLPLIMCLQCSKIFQGLCSWVFDIVLAPFGATVAWNA